MGSDTNKKSDTITKRSTSSCLQIFLFVTLACFLLPFLIDVLVPSRYLEIQKMGAGKSKDALPPLKAMNKVLNSKGAQNFMGYWYVASCKPTFLEKGVHNSLEHYEWVDKEQSKLRVTFKYQSSATQKNPSVMYQDGRVVNKETGAEWVVRPRLFNGIVPLPVWLPFIILDSEVDETPEKSFMVVGQPDRSYLWIMFRTPHYDQELYATVEQKCIDEWGYKKEDIVIVPHNWDDDQLLITDPADFEL